MRADRMRQPAMAFDRGAAGQRPCQRFYRQQGRAARHPGHGIGHRARCSCCGASSFGRTAMKLIATLRAAGLTDSQILQQIEEAAAKRRQQNRKAQRNHRACQHDIADIADSPPSPPSPITPSPLTPIPLASLAAQPPTQAELERDLFKRGKQVLGKSAGGMIATLLKSREYDVALARSVIELAATKSDAREFIAAAIRAKGNGYGRSERPNRLAEAFDSLRSKLAARQGQSVDGLLSDLRLSQPGGVSGDVMRDSGGVSPGDRGVRNRPQDRPTTPMQVAPDTGRGGRGMRSRDQLAREDLDLFEREVSTALAASKVSRRG